MNFFISATDTDVGKSYVASRLANEFCKMGLKTAYLKPFQSGIEKDILSDENQVKNFAKNVITKSSYITKTPCTPLISAQIDKIEFDINKIKKDYNELSNSSDITIVEGSGGLCVPVCKNILMADIIKELNLPMLLIARPNLGTINHTLLSINYAQSKGIKILGIVLSNYPKETNDPAILKAKEMIEAFCNTKVIAIIYQNQNDLSELAKALI